VVVVGEKEPEKDEPGDRTCLVRLGKMGKDQPFLIHRFYRGRKRLVDKKAWAPLILPPA
jgi:hypothetical protein